MVWSIPDGLGMKHLFYSDWTNRRVTRITNIFGKSWFGNKSILELGAAHGDIGIEFLKLGADVIFSDARHEHLVSIRNKLLEFEFEPKTKCINQNEQYVLKEQYDLILHLGVLYHIENWKHDLECVMKHTGKMILETIVDPSQGDEPQPDMRHPTYGPYECNNSHFSQEDVEAQLTTIGCKYVRFDNSELNCSGWLNEKIRDNHHYDWTYQNYKTKSSPGLNHFRRMWLVLK